MTRVALAILSCSLLAAAPAPGAAQEGPRPLAPLGLRNLEVFTRLFGYVRHFHPSDAAATADWGALAREGVRIAEPAADARDLARRLETFFRPVAPTLLVHPTAEKPAIPKGLAPTGDPGLEVVAWRHRGFGQDIEPNPFYASERVRKGAPGGRIPEGSTNPAEPLRADLGGGVSCLVALSLFADAGGTLPHGTARKGEDKEARPAASGNDRATRLGDVVLLWNILQHFYPYFDEVKVDWPAALREALASAAGNADERAFLDTLRRMLVHLQDGHGNVNHRCERGGAGVPPVVLGWVEDRLAVVHAAREGAEKLRPGDVVLQVDGRPAAEVVAEREKLICGATPGWRRYKAVFELSTGVPESPVSLKVQGAAQPVTLRRTKDLRTFSQEFLPPTLHEIKPGIVYLDLIRARSEKDFLEALPRLQEATGIVFDVRGYPDQGAKRLISHLVDAPVQSAFFNTPIVTAPDHVPPRFETSRWTLVPKEPRLKAKTAFLIGPNMISYAESILGIIEGCKLGPIVGEPTAGTNGNIITIILPGGYRVMWTGLKVIKHDGSPHHGVGIRPTVPVSRTLKGIREGRDEVMDRAIELVSK